MGTAAQVIERVSRRLVDQDPGYRYQVWDKTDLLGALNNALSVIGRNRPELFGTLTTFDLPTDGILSVPCSMLRSPLTLLDKNGKRIRTLSQSEESPTIADLTLCTGIEGGPLYLWARSETQYEAWPTEALRNGYKVRGLCVSIPQLESDGEAVPVPTDFIAILEELMLYYANAYDQESTSAQRRSALHWANAMTLLGVSSAAQ